MTTVFPHGLEMIVQKLVWIIRRAKLEKHAKQRARLGAHLGERCFFQYTVPLGIVLQQPKFKARGLECRERLTSNCSNILESGCCYAMIVVQEHSQVEQLANIGVHGMNAPNAWKMVITLPLGPLLILWIISKVAWERRIRATIIVIRILRNVL